MYKPQGNKTTNVMSKNLKGITSQVQNYTPFHFLKSNTWSTTRTGGNTVDMKPGVIFESNSQKMRNAIKNVQTKRDQTERQIRFNNIESMVTGGGSGSSQPYAYGKKTTLDYFKLKEGLQDLTPKLSSTDMQILLLGAIALLLFLK